MKTAVGPRTKSVSIDADVLAVLNNATITENSVALVGQLERALYGRVNKVLELAGGKWNRGRRVHVFDSDPREKLGLAMESGSIVDKKKSLQQFFTPEPVAAMLVQHLRVAGGTRCLEPSAGHGAIAKALRDAGGDVVCVEIDPECGPVLHAAGFALHEADFLAWNEDRAETFDAIAMNPPFTAWQDVLHVTRAFSMLRPGGMLAAIVSPMALQKTTRKERAFQELFNAYGVVEDSVPAGSFSESGTEIATRVVVLHKPR